MALVSIGASMSSLDLTLMFVAFPEIQKDFPGVPRAELSWVLTSFTIVAAALLIPAGRFADRLGRKRVFLSSLLLFTVGSALVGAAEGQEIELPLPHGNRRSIRIESVIYQPEAEGHFAL